MRLSPNPILRKLRINLNEKFQIEKIDDYLKFIPSPYKAVVTITADFELAWAWRYTKSSNNPFKKAINKALKERENIPKILKLCEKFNIPITWATVGHLFLNECKQINGVVHPEIKRLNHFENKFWKFNGKDWFEYDPCTNYQENPLWYCPDLIELILRSSVKHEIGCHTFSHIDCSDEICREEVFEDEIKSCIKAAERYNINLETFVHPAHTIGNLKKLSELGFTSYQSNSNNILGYPRRLPNGLWELKRTYEAIFNHERSIKSHIDVYKNIIDNAIKNNSVCNLWFHPSINKKYVDLIMPEFFNYLNSKRDEVLIITVNDFIKILNKQLVNV